ncbi:MAG: S41 family peptidase [Lachnospiraceae bacterium]|nr:S41 family peptidase [Lachnospiraceae bacterium]
MKKHLGFASGVIVGLVAAILIVFIIGGARYFGFVGLTSSSSDSVSSNLAITPAVLSKLNNLNKMIDKKYLKYSDDLQETPAVEGLYKGLFESLGDPYSEYYTADEFKSYNTSLEGTFEGIGATITQDPDTKEFKVAALTDNSPALKSGVQVGDIFYTVDGEKIGDISLTDLVSKVRGKKGTTVTIQFLRGENREVVTLPIVRDSIDAVTVSVNMLDNDTGYMILASFDKVTKKQFDEGFDKLKKQGMKRMILDLRGNLGGDVDVCVHIADALLPKGLIVYTMDKDNNKLSWDSDDEHQLGMPLVVLVDRRSASASEILTGAIKDSGTGLIVGTTTFGKGIVQDVYQLNDGSAIKLTTRKYYTPSGNNIHGEGIKPDVEIEFDTDKYVEDRYDNQLEKAKELISKM